MEIKRRWLGFKILGGITICFLLVALGIIISNRQVKNKNDVSSFKDQSSSHGLKENTSSPEIFKPPIGSKPEQNSDGSVELVREYLKSQSTHAGRLEFLEWSEVSSSGNYWTVRCKYTGISSFNKEVTTNSWFYIRNNKVIFVKTISKI